MIVILLQFFICNYCTAVQHILFQRMQLIKAVETMYIVHCCTEGSRQTDNEGFILNERERVDNLR